MDVRLGEILADKYRVDRILGAGGMGQVLQVTHLELDQRFAIKLMLPQVLGYPELVQRFLREAKAAVRLRSEHVARVTDVGRLPTGIPYMVMEYLEGEDINALTKRRGALSVEEAIEYVIQACDALAEAHMLGIVHRDIKPANLFLTHRLDGTPCVKVLDFGISKLSEEQSGEPGLTRTSVVMGSAYFMSPEQMQSARDVDHRTDIWALGVTLYKLLTGSLPFRGDSLHQVSAQVLRDAPRPLSQIRPEIPSGLEAVVLRCLEKNPAARHANIGDFVVALSPFAHPRVLPLVERIAKLTGVSSAAPRGATLPYEKTRPLDSGGTALIAGSTERMESSPVGVVTGAPVHVTRAPQVPRRSRGMGAGVLVGGGVVALLLGGVFVFLLMRRPLPENGTGTHSSGQQMEAAGQAEPARTASLPVELGPPATEKVDTSPDGGVATAAPAPTPKSTPAVTSKQATPTNRGGSPKPAQPAPASLVLDDDGPRK